MDILIFVTLGTQDKEFKRLLDAVEKLEIKEKIIAQIGNTKFKNSYYTCRSRNYNTWLKNQKANDSSSKRS